MTVYSLINLLSTACAPDAPFMRDSKLWWIPDSQHPKGGFLMLQPHRPSRLAIDVSANENGVFRVGL